MPAFRESEGRVKPVACTRSCAKDRVQRIRSDLIWETAIGSPGCRTAPKFSTSPEI